LKTHEKTLFEEFYGSNGIRFAVSLPLDRGRARALATSREAGKKARFAIRFLRCRPLKIEPT